MRWYPQWLKVFFALPLLLHGFAVLAQNVSTEDSNPPKVDASQKNETSQSTSGSLLPFFSSAKRFPVEIDAENGVEWLREEKVYVAKGNAVVRYEKTTLRADELRAYYTESETAKGPQVWLLEARGHVKIESEKGHATGDILSYDIPQGYAKFLGDLIVVDGPDFSLTAHKMIEFWNDKNLATAEGGVYLKQAKQYLYADQVTAHFKDTTKTPVKDSTKNSDHSPLSSSDSKNIEYIVAKSQNPQHRVIVVSEQGIAQGDEGEYWVAEQLVKLRGHVRLTHQQNQLNGAAAEFNMKTGAAKITSSGSDLSPTGSQESELVQGYFIPDTDSSDGDFFSITAPSSNIIPSALEQNKP